MRHLLIVLLMFVTGAGKFMRAAESPLPAAPATTAPAPAPMRVAPADADAVKSASALVREVYAGRYAVKTDRGRRTLGRMMLRHVAWHRTNPALVEVLLRESLRLACEADDHETMLAAIDALDAAFTGVSIADERSKAFQQIERKPFVAALQKLLETPDDARSCGVAGRWLGPVAGRWTEALPLLQRATTEPVLQKAAEGELAASTPVLVLQAAEAWMDAAKRGKGDERIGMLKHAQDLATRALPDLTGASKTKAAQLIAKAEPQIPLDLDQVDWSTLTGEQWERIALPAIPLIAKTDRTDTGIMLAAGETVRVVPNPDDRWSFQLVGEEKTPVVTDWKGVSRTYTYTVSDNNGIRSVTVTLGIQRIRFGAVVAFIDVNQRMRAGVIRGPGKLMLGPASNRRGEAGTSGAIRVKIVPVDG